MSTLRYIISLSTPAHSFSLTRDLRLKILLTGSSGRIGRAIYRQLAERHDLVCLDLIPSATTDLVASISDHTAITKSYGRSRRGDSCCRLTCASCWFAQRGGVQTPQCTVDLSLNTLGSEFRCSKICIYEHHGIIWRSIVKAGRAAWITEATVPEPRTIYHHQTKLQAETGLKQLSEDTGLSVSVIRMSRAFLNLSH